MHEEGINISLKADHLFDIFGFSITNTILSSIFLSFLLIFIVIFIIKKSRLRPSKPQLILEILINGGYTFTKETLGDEKISRKIYPFLATLFFTILFFNLAKFLPGMESLHWGGVHLFKPVHSDLNMALALAVVAWILVQVLGVSILGIIKYSGKFIQIVKIKNIPIINPIGILEMISEIAKMFSLSFRLFINILVGGIMIILLEQVSHIGVPVIGILFEIFVAFLQAGVFALLTLFYIKLAISEPH